MLQQTQVARVVPRYEAWLERWPDARRARRPRRAPTCSRRGSGSATTAAPLRLHEACARRRARRLAADATGCARCPASGRTPRRRSPRSPSASRWRRSTRTCAASPRGSGAGSAGGRCCPAGRAARLEPGDDGARRDGLPRARAALRRLPGRGVVRVARARRRRRRAPRAGPRERFEDSTAGCAGGSSPRWRRARGCRTRSPAERLERALAASCATGSSCATPPACDWGDAAPRAGRLPRR